ncbi:MAG: hypothetical protein M1826_000893 [Phylliscum demangeonii]|nr:MAG: hypothetical protein M1826_000893 [Phylliscum demangeonii]
MTPLIVSLVLFLTGADAFWRLPCRGRIGVGRIDPLVDFGAVGEHAHALHGGNNFDFSSTYDDLLKSNCTSCQVTEDKSVYWTPALYFQADDGKMTMVEQAGGMLVYYLLFGEKVKAFPAHFQMIAGDGLRRNFTLPVPDPPKSEWSGDQITESALRQKAVGFNCLDYKKNPEPTLFRHFLPDKAYLDANCHDGVRFELMFPSCWSGKVDSADHMSHVAYPDQVMTGNCPKGYDQRLISMLYEIIWETNAFAGQGGRFVLANGDPTGYGLHGDFIAGWDEAFLQQAVDTCDAVSGRVEDCPVFAGHLQSEDQQRQCLATMPSELNGEDCKGPRDGLPGAVAIQSGPEPARRHRAAAAADSSPVPAAPAAPAAASSSSTTMPTLSYTPAVPTAAPESSSIGSSILTPQLLVLATPQPSSLSSSLLVVSSSSASSSSSISNTTPATTPAPSALATDDSFIGTSYYTEGDTVVEVMIVKKLETVTASASAPPVVVTVTDDSGTDVVTATATTTIVPASQAYKAKRDVKQHLAHHHQYLHRRSGRPHQHQAAAHAHVH